MMCSIAVLEKPDPEEKKVTRMVGAKDSGF